MTPRVRRILQALLYETIAVIALGPVLAVLFDQPIASTLALSVTMSAVALAWNYVFNTLFERWESRQRRAGRSIWRRVVHGIGFEGGLVVMLVPLMAYWLDISLLTALLTDLSILVFFLLYTVAFHWSFDAVFGLPESARGRCDT